VLVSNYLEIRLYGFGEGTEAYERFDMARLHEPQEYARFMLLLGADNLLSGKTADLLKESRKEDKDITDALYADYKALRSTLIEGIRQTAPTINPLESIATAQTILDRVLFIAFAEDTGLLPKNILEQAFESEDKFNPRPVWDNFKGLFNAIDKGSNGLGVPKYNGGLFAPDAAIDALTLTNDVCERFKKIGDYDFASEISVTVLGHIFEQSIADVERLQAIARGEEVEEEKAKGTSGRRKRDGVVYTPDYIARFIVEQTAGTHIREMFDATVQTFAKKGADVTDYENIPWKRKSGELEAWRAYRDSLTKLRIVDPACGSGVFLVMAFDYLKAELNRVNDKIAELEGKDKPDFFNPDSEILTNNLFGVDVNSESVEIAKLSLWIKTARRGKVLDSLDANIMVGDSLIEDSNYAYLDQPFTWKDAFPDVFAEGGFDIVLGNPPYVRMEFLKAMKPYLEKRFEVVSDRADLYAYFFERGLKLLKDGGRMGFISSSTFFKTGSGKPLREFLLREATLELSLISAIYRCLKA
jgi:type I restriction-modification system DNA methylase subunit